MPTNPQDEFIQFDDLEDGLESFFGDELNARFQALKIASNVSLRYQKAWSSALPYKLNDVVSQSGSFWIAVTANTNSQPADANTNWSKFGGGSGGAGSPLQLQTYSLTATTPLTVSGPGGTVSVTPGDSLEAPLSAATGKTVTVNPSSTSTAATSGTANLATGGTASASVSTGTSANAFDGNTNTSWSNGSNSLGSSQWLQYNRGSGNAAMLSNYSVKVSGDPAYPTAWTLAGSNDGTTWTTLDAKSGQFAGLGLGQSGTAGPFTISSGVAWQYFRLTVTATGNGASPSIAELVLIGGGAAGSINATFTLPDGLNVVLLASGGTLTETQRGNQAGTAGSILSQKELADSASRNTAPRLVTQTGHGFIEGGLIGITSTNDTYASLSGTSEANYHFAGQVTKVLNANQFLYQPCGPIVRQSYSLSAGQYEFFANGMAGNFPLSSLSAGTFFGRYLLAINASEGILLPAKLQQISPIFTASQVLPTTTRTVRIDLAATSQVITLPDVTTMAGLLLAEDAHLFVKNVGTVTGNVTTKDGDFYAGPGSVATMSLMGGDTLELSPEQRANGTWVWQVI